MKKPHLILCICIIVIFLIGVQVLFSIPAPCKWLDAVWDAGDFISFVGTISLGLVAIYQTKNANEVSFRLLQIEEDRRRPQIDIRAISESKLKKYDRDQLISASIEDTYVFVDNEWNETENPGNNFWFEIKNVKDTDIINIQPIIARSKIIDSNKVCIASNKYRLSTSCNLNLIQGNDAVPFLLGMNSIWAKVAEKPNQHLQLSLEFAITNFDGEEYLEQISLDMVNAYNCNILTPAILRKDVCKSELIRSPK